MVELECGTERIITKTSQCVLCDALCHIIIHLHTAAFSLLTLIFTFFKPFVSPVTQRLLTINVNLVYHATYNYFHASHHASPFCLFYIFPISQVFFTANSIMSAPCFLYHYIQVPIAESKL